MNGAGVASVGRSVGPTMSTEVMVSVANESPARQRCQRLTIAAV